MDELRNEFRLWGVVDVQYPIFKEQAYGKPVVVQFVPPNAKVWTKVSCGKFSEPRINLRAILQAIEATRKMDQRGMGAVLAQASAHLLLPASTVPETKSPEQVLGIVPGMGPKAQIDQFRKREMETHPDKGGNAEEFRKVREAAIKLGLL